MLTFLSDDLSQFAALKYNLFLINSVDNKISPLLQSMLSPGISFTSLIHFLKEKPLNAVSFTLFT